MVEQGLSSEAFSRTGRESKEVVIFLMNLFERYGEAPGQFKRELRRAMVNELAELAGLEGGWAAED